MSTRISSLSIRTTCALDDVAVLEALDVGVLLGEQLLHRRRLGAEVARGAGDRLGASSSPAAGASAVSSTSARRSSRGGVGVGGLGGGVGLGGRCGGVGSALGGSLGRVGSGSAVGVGRGSAAARRRRRLGRRPAPRRRRRPRRSRPRRRVGGVRRSARGVSRRRSVGARRAGGGLVGDGDGRDGLLGRLVGVGGDRLRLPARSRPAALRSSVWSLLVDRFAPRIDERPERRSGRGPKRSEWSVVIGPAVRSFVVEWPGRRSSAVLPLEGRESLAQRFCAATIARPCPNCPI